MDLSHSMPQRLQNMVKKKKTNKQQQKKNKGGVPITELLNICTYFFFLLFIFALQTYIKCLQY